MRQRGITGSTMLMSTYCNHVYSSLDAESEAAVQATLDEICQNQIDISMCLVTF
jgi:hypothetical protein